ncbi:MAG: alkaline phosphatase family protein, partial [Methylocella sp.]
GRRRALLLGAREQGRPTRLRIRHPSNRDCPDVNGLQLFEWGTHDRNFAISSEPPSLLEEIREKYGDHPINNCDSHGETHEGYANLLSGLKRGASTKTRIYLDYLQREPWDLFNVCYTESHCAGHQFWHFLDPNHPKHDPNAPDDFKNAVRDVYAEIDKGIGMLVEAAGPGAKIVLVASHGMALYSGGPYLLNEVLARLGLTSEGEDTMQGRFWRSLQFSSNPVIRALRKTLKQHVGKRVIQTIQARSGSLHEPFSHPETRAADLYNNRCGAIRLNLKGREPMGEVARGNEEAELIETIRETLLELKHPVTRDPSSNMCIPRERRSGPTTIPTCPISWLCSGTILASSNHAGRNGWASSSGPCTGNCCRGRAITPRTRRCGWSMGRSRPERAMMAAMSSTSARPCSRCLVLRLQTTSTAVL